MSTAIRVLYYYSVCIQSYTIFLFQSEKYIYFMDFLIAQLQNGCNFICNTFFFQFTYYKICTCCFQRKGNISLGL